MSMSDIIQIWYISKKSTRVNFTMTLVRQCHMSKNRFAAVCNIFVTKPEQTSSCLITHETVEVDITIKHQVSEVL